MRARPSRQRGTVSLFLVVTAFIVLGAFVLASGARVAPLTRETQRLLVSDQALALAEAGLLAARAELRRGDADLAQLRDVPLGPGRFRVRIEAREGAEVVVLTEGTTAADRLLGLGATLTRRVRARLRIEPGDLPTVLTWEEL